MNDDKADSGSNPRPQALDREEVNALLSLRDMRVVRVPACAKAQVRFVALVKAGYATAVPHGVHGYIVRPTPLGDHVAPVLAPTDYRWPR